MTPTLFLLALSGAPEISERMASPPAFVVTSAKAPQDLEFCVGDMLSDMAAPAALRDGPNRTVMVAWSFDKVQAVVDMRRTGTTTTLTGYVRGKGWDDRLRAAVERCAV